MPAMANWPRLMWPPHPVRMTRDTATIAQTIAIAASSWLDGPHDSGTKTSRASTPMARTTLAMRISGRWRSSSGTGLITPSELNAALSEFIARDSEARCSSRAMRITARKNMVVIDGLPVPFQRTSWSRMPRPMPAAKAMGRDSRRATTAAARAGSRTAGPAETTDGDTPEEGACST